jgi:hypothetical protein
MKHLYKDECWRNIVWRCDRIHLVRKKDQWRVLVNTKINFPFTWVAGNSLAIWATVHFSRTIIIDGVSFKFMYTWVSVCPRHHWFTHRTFSGMHGAPASVGHRRCFVYLHGYLVNFWYEARTEAIGGSISCLTVWAQVLLYVSVVLTLKISSFCPQFPFMFSV